jgi:GNAT superfamily N-acetyltransferase
MYWRMKRPDFEAMKGDSNRAAMQAIVAAGRPPGILAYVDGQPAGWCSIAPRDEFPRLAGSRVAKRVDDQPVWSIVCFFVAKARRNQRLTVGLIQAAVRYAQSQGAKIVEAYPVEPHNERMPDVFAYTGIASAFRKAGFVEVARRSAGRPVMRYPG